MVRGSWRSRSVFGLARNERLEALIADELAEASAKARDSGKPNLIFDATKLSKAESRERRVVAKAEHLPKGKNPRQHRQLADMRSH